MKLRPYQSEALTHIGSYLKDHSSTMLVMATGLGKTVVFSHLADGWQGRVMVLAHRRELISQAAKKLREVTGEWPAVEQGEMRSNESTMGKCRHIVASKDSLHAVRLQKFTDIALLVIDEAHHATRNNLSYTSIIQHLAALNPSLKILGVTATPKRADGIAMASTFDSVAYQYEICQAIDDGWLVPISPKIVTVHGLDLSSVRTTAGDLSAADLNKILSQESMAQGIADAIHSLTRNRSKILIFTAGVQQAIEIAGQLNRREPDAARWLCGDLKLTSKQYRASSVHDYAMGKFRYMVNCGLFTEGFDDPEIDCVVMARPTKSEALYKQMLGRGTRTLPDLVDGLSCDEARRTAIAGSGKPNLLVLDFADNSKRHKLVTTIDVLGGKMPDEVLAMAKTRAAASTSDDGVEMREVLKQAEQDQREAEAARVIAKARFDEEDVDIFDGSSRSIGSTVTDRKVVMMWGKYRGVPLHEIPTGYLSWVDTNDKARGWLAKAVSSELRARKMNEDYVPSRGGGGRSVNIDEINDLLRGA